MPQIDLRDSLPTRSAEALFWLGRNAERAEAATRTARLVIARVGSDPALLDSPWLGHAIAALRAVSGGRPLGEREAACDGTGRAGGEIAAALDDRSGAVANSLRHLAANAGGVREFLSTATWRVLNGLDAERSVLSSTTDRSDPFLVTECLDRIMVDLAALAGLVMESMVRGPGWRFLDLGRRLERAVLLLGVIEATLSDPPADDVAQPVYDLVLGAPARAWSPTAAGTAATCVWRRSKTCWCTTTPTRDRWRFNSTGSTNILPRCRGTPTRRSTAGSSMPRLAGRLGEGPDSLAKLVLGCAGRCWS